MPASLPISTGQSPNPPVHATPCIKPRDWHAALNNASSKPCQTNMPADTDHPTTTDAKQDQPRSAPHAGIASTASTAQSPKGDDSLPASSPMSPACGHTTPHLTKNTYKTNNHQNQTQANPQLPPVAVPVTANAPAPVTTPTSKDDAQARRTDTEYHAARSALTVNAAEHVQTSGAAAQTQAGMEMPDPSPAPTPRQGPTNKAERPMLSKAAQTSVPTADQALIAHNLRAAMITSASAPQDQNQNSPALTKPAAGGQIIQPFALTTPLNNGGTLTTVDKAAPTSPSALSESVSLSASALSATITALHQSGQNGVTLRVDPPNLGHLSIHVKLDMQGAVNVLFVPSTSDAAQALQGSLPQLGTALAQSGLALGHADIGGQFFQSGGQNSQQNGYTPPRQPALTTISADAAPSQPSGLSAYA